MSQAHLLNTLGKNLLLMTLVVKVEVVLIAGYAVEITWEYLTEDIILVTYIRTLKVYRH
jgi:hypothetical protein